MNMNKIKTTEASWNIDLNVECPYCDHFFDATDYMTMGDLPTVGQSQKDIELDITCPECSENFRIISIIS